MCTLSSSLGIYICIYLLSYGYDVRGALICFVGDGCDGESRGSFLDPLMR